MIRRAFLQALAALLAFRWPDPPRPVVVANPKTGASAPGFLVREYFNPNARASGTRVIVRHEDAVALTSRAVLRPGGEICVFDGRGSWIRISPRGMFIHQATRDVSGRGPRRC